LSIDERLLALVAANREGVLATIKKDGRPQLSNVLYLWDAETTTARISTTADRAKARNLRRDPRGSLYVAGDHFWAYAVAEGVVTIAGPSVEPGDEAGQQLLAVHSVFNADLDEEAFFQEMVEAHRLVVKLRVSHTYGVVLDRPPR
jgi:PPOX class probable F420-dependent enzyme